MAKQTARINPKVPVVMMAGGEVLGSIEPNEYFRLVAEKKVAHMPAFNLSKPGSFSMITTYVYDVNGRIESTKRSKRPRTKSKIRRSDSIGVKAGGKQ